MRPERHILWHQTQESARRRTDPTPPGAAEGTQESRPGAALLRAPQAHRRQAMFRQACAIGPGGHLGGHVALQVPREERSHQGELLVCIWRASKKGQVRAVRARPLSCAAGADDLVVACKGASAPPLRLGAHLVMWLSDDLSTAFASPQRTQIKRIAESAPLPQLPRRSRTGARGWGSKSPKGWGVVRNKSPGRQLGWAPSDAMPTTGECLTIGAASRQNGP